MEMQTPSKSTEMEGKKSRPVRFPWLSHVNREIRKVLSSDVDQGKLIECMDFYLRHAREETTERKRTSKFVKTMPGIMYLFKDVNKKYGYTPAYLDRMTKMLQLYLDAELRMSSQVIIQGMWPHHEDVANKISLQIDVHLKGQDPSHILGVFLASLRSQQKDHRLILDRLYAKYLTVRQWSPNKVELSDRLMLMYIIGYKQWANLFLDDKPKVLDIMKNFSVYKPQETFLRNPKIPEPLRTVFSQNGLVQELLTTCEKVDTLKQFLEGFVEEDGLNTDDVLSADLTDISMLSIGETRLNPHEETCASSSTIISEILSPQVFAGSSHSRSVTMPSPRKDYHGCCEVKKEDVTTHTVAIIDLTEDDKREQPMQWLQNLVRRARDAEKVPVMRCPQGQMEVEVICLSDEETDVEVRQNDPQAMDVDGVQQKNLCENVMHWSEGDSSENVHRTMVKNREMLDNITSNLDEMISSDKMPQVQNVTNNGDIANVNSAIKFGVRDHLVGSSPRNVTDTCSNNSQQTSSVDNSSLSVGGDDSQNSVDNYPIFNEIQMSGGSGESYGRPPSDSAQQQFTDHHTSFFGDEKRRKQSPEICDKSENVIFSTAPLQRRPLVTDVDIQIARKEESAAERVLFSTPKPSNLPMDENINQIVSDIMADFSDVEEIISVSHQQDGRSSESPAMGNIDKHDLDDFLEQMNQRERLTRDHRAKEPIRSILNKTSPHKPKNKRVKKKVQFGTAEYLEPDNIPSGRPTALEALTAGQPGKTILKATMKKYPDICTNPISDIELSEEKNSSIVVKRTYMSVDGFKIRQNKASSSKHVESDGLSSDSETGIAMNIPKIVMKKINEGMSLGGSTEDRISSSFYISSPNNPHCCPNASSDGQQVWGHFEEECRNLDIENFPNIKRHNPDSTLRNSTTECLTSDGIEDSSPNKKRREIKSQFSEVTPVHSPIVRSESTTLSYPGKKMLSILELTPNIQTSDAIKTELDVPTTIVPTGSGTFQIVNVIPQTTNIAAVPVYNILQSSVGLQHLRTIGIQGDNKGILCTTTGVTPATTNICSVIQNHPLQLTSNFLSPAFTTYSLQPISSTSQIGISQMNLRNIVNVAQRYQQFNQQNIISPLQDVQQAPVNHTTDPVCPSTSCYDDGCENCDQNVQNAAILSEEVTTDVITDYSDGISKRQSFPLDIDLMKNKRNILKDLVLCDCVNNTATTKTPQKRKLLNNLRKRVGLSNIFICLFTDTGDHKLGKKFTSMLKLPHSSHQMERCIDKSKDIGSTDCRQDQVSKTSIRVEKVRSDVPFEDVITKKPHRRLKSPPPPPPSLKLTLSLTGTRSPSVVVEKSPALSEIIKVDKTERRLENLHSKLYNAVVRVETLVWPPVENKDEKESESHVEQVLDTSATLRKGRCRKKTKENVSEETKERRLVSPLRVKLPDMRTDEHLLSEALAESVRQFKCLDVEEAAPCEEVAEKPKNIRKSSFVNMQTPPPLTRSMKKKFIDLKIEETNTGSPKLSKKTRLKKQCPATVGLDKSQERKWEEPSEFGFSNRNQKTLNDASSPSAAFIDDTSTLKRKHAQSVDDSCDAKKIQVSSEQSQSEINPERIDPQSSNSFQQVNTALSNVSYESNNVTNSTIPIPPSLSSNTNRKDLLRLTKKSLKIVLKDPRLKHYRAIVRLRRLTNVDVEKIIQHIEKHPEENIESLVISGRIFQACGFDESTITEAMKQAKVCPVESESRDVETDERLKNTNETAEEAIVESIDTNEQHAKDQELIPQINADDEEVRNENSKRGRRTEGKRSKPPRKFPSHLNDKLLEDVDAQIQLKPISVLSISEEIAKMASPDSTSSHGEANKLVEEEFPIKSASPEYVTSTISSTVNTEISSTTQISGNSSPMITVDSYGERGNIAVSPLRTDHFRDDECQESDKKKTPVHETEKASFNGPILRSMRGFMPSPIYNAEIQIELPKKESKRLIDKKSQLVAVSCDSQGDLKEKTPIELTEPNNPIESQCDQVEDINKFKNSEQEEDIDRNVEENKDEEEEECFMDSDNLCNEDESTETKEETSPNSEDKRKYDIQVSESKISEEESVETNIPLESDSLDVVTERNDATPARIDVTPVRREESPERRYSTPDRSDATPVRSHVSPDRSNAISFPDITDYHHQSSQLPERVETSVEQVKSEECDDISKEDLDNLSDATIDFEDFDSMSDYSDFNSPQSIEETDTDVQEVAEMKTRNTSGDDKCLDAAMMNFDPSDAFRETPDVEKSQENQEMANIDLNQEIHEKDHTFFESISSIEESTDQNYLVDNCALLANGNNGTGKLPSPDSSNNHNPPQHNMHNDPIGMNCDALPDTSVHLDSGHFMTNSGDNEVDNMVMSNQQGYENLFSTSMYAESHGDQHLRNNGSNAMVQQLMYNEANLVGNNQSNNMLLEPDSSANIEQNLAIDDLVEEMPSDDTNLITESDIFDEYCDNLTSIADNVTVETESEIVTEAFGGQTPHTVDDFSAVFKDMSTVPTSLPSVSSSFLTPPVTFASSIPDIGTTRKSDRQRIKSHTNLYVEHEYSPKTDTNRITSSSNTSKTGDRYLLPPKSERGSRKRSHNGVKEKRKHRQKSNYSQMSMSNISNQGQQRQQHQQQMSLPSMIPQNTSVEISRPRPIVPQSGTPPMPFLTLSTAKNRGIIDRKADDRVTTAAVSSYLETHNSLQQKIEQQKCSPVYHSPQHMAANCDNTIRRFRRPNRVDPSNNQSSVQPVYEQISPGPTDKQMKTVNEIKTFNMIPSTQSIAALASVSTQKRAAPKIEVLSDRMIHPLTADCTTPVFTNNLGGYHLVQYTTAPIIANPSDFCIISTGIQMPLPVMQTNFTNSTVSGAQSTFQPTKIILTPQQTELPQFVVSETDLVGDSLNASN
ncbi:hypothetical protein DMENIID0001_049400 [Sergentomyia squamirostris]